MTRSGLLVNITHLVSTLSPSSTDFNDTVSQSISVSLSFLVHDLFLAVSSFVSAELGSTLIVQKWDVVVPKIQTFNLIIFSIVHSLVWYDLQSLCPPPVPLSPPVGCRVVGLKDVVKSFGFLLSFVGLFAVWACCSSGSSQEALTPKSICTGFRRQRKLSSGQSLVSHHHGGHFNYKVQVF